MSDVKWIKIVTDIFDDEKMLLIDSLPESDGIIVIWFKLLCLAGKQNNNGVFMLNDKIAYTDEMISAIFRRPLNTVRLALKTFEQYGMIEIINNAITIPNWEKHQDLSKLERNKELNRQRVAKSREKQKLIVQNSKCNGDVIITEALPNGDVMGAEEDKNKNKSKNKNDTYTSTCVEIIDYLNGKAKTAYKAKSKSTQQLIKARLNDGFTVDDFKKVIDNKCAEWLGSEWEKYLRPTTLFGNKFENYLNQKTVTNNQQNKSNMQQPVTQNEISAEDEEYLKAIGAWEE